MKLTSKQINNAIKSTKSFKTAIKKTTSSEELYQLITAISMVDKNYLNQHLSNKYHIEFRIPRHSNTSKGRFYANEMKLTVPMVQKYVITSINEKKHQRA